jgi:hypothetical protein
VINLQDMNTVVRKQFELSNSVRTYTVNSILCHYSCEVKIFENKPDLAGAGVNQAAGRIGHRCSRQCRNLNTSQPYRPPRPVTGIALVFYFYRANHPTKVTGKQGNNKEQEHTRNKGTNEHD